MLQQPPHRTWMRMSLLTIAFGWFLAPMVLECRALAQEEAKGPWVTAIAVDGASQQVLAATGTGLPLRASNLMWAESGSKELKPVAEFPASLWRVILNGDQAIVSDYSGTIHSGPRNAKEGWQAWEPKLRWSRALLMLDAQRLLVGTEDGKLVVGDVATRKFGSPIDGHAAAIFNLSLSADKQWVVSSGGDGVVKIWRSTDLGMVREIKVGSHAVWDAMLTQDGSSIITADAGRRVQRYDATSGQFQVCITSLPDWATCLCRLDNESFAVGCLNGKVFIIDATHSRPAAVLTAARSGVWSLASSADGERLWVGTRSHGLQIFAKSNWNALLSESQQRSDEPPSPK